MANLTALEDWVGPFLQRIEPAARTKLARAVAQQLRRSQQQRILAQRNTDGSPYAPRKPRQLRGKRGRLRRKVKMFQKLHTATYLKARGQASAATVGFSGRIARIARTHQFGLRDKATPDARAVAYNRRELLGLTDSDLEMIRNTLASHLSI
ncbi:MULTISPECIES: phage virion morphogenesis protein [Pseudomonas]|uniref:phage virion morphogenesis protein n=1 Tax=Pseudomonas TaxID=286 RepID=UPI000D85C61A|nr:MULTISPECIES: phage virion morphogenesis protein [Pseudomonas]MCP3788918.1 phage virion morphogenesis protein [Pseudomonas sp. N2-11]PYB93580.1 phage virion morphogenesis protein [Pseudomonas fulva]PYC16405.1 phage virion morphogenesis protein [Pseudomonas fulva]